MFIKNIKIQKKLPFALVALVALTISTLCTAEYLGVREKIVNHSTGNLNRISEVHASQVEALLAKIDSGLRRQANDPVVADATTQFAGAFSSLNTPMETLQQSYIADNPYPTGEKDKQLSSQLNTPYDAIHRQYHPIFSTLKDTMGYYDIFLFDTAGNLTYSVFKENDFATNMMDGEWSDSGLGQVYRMALALEADDNSAFVDFAPYGPSFGAPAAFIARPIFNGSERVGVVAYQMPVDDLNATAVDLFGETGAAFLAGADGLMRTDNPRTETNDILTSDVRSPALQAGVNGDTGTLTYTSADGTEVVGAHRPINFPGVNWIMIAEQTTDELFVELSQLLRIQIASAGILLAVATVIALLLSRSLSVPLQRVNRAVGKVAQKEFEINVPDTDRGDEIGDIAKALDDFRLSLSAAEATAVEAAFKSAAFETTGAPMLLTDLEMKIVGANSAFLRLVQENAADFGVENVDMSAEGLVGSSVADMSFLPKEIKVAMRDLSNVPIRRKLPVGKSFVGLLVDVVQNKEGEPVGYVIDLKNQTFQMASEVLVQAIDGQQARVELDLDGTVRAVNERMEDCLSQQASDLIGTNAKSKITFQQDNSADFWARAEQGEGTVGRFLISGGSGQRILSGSFSPVPNQDGETIGFLLIGADVTTERAEIEAAERETERAAEAQARVVETLSIGLQRIAEGDLTVSIDHQLSADYEELRKNFNEAISSLRSALDSVVINASQIGNEAKDIDASVAELSKRTENQAATLEETAAAMHELTASVTSSAQGAETAAKIAADARENAQSSGGIVREAATAMTEIETSSQEVSKIIGVIDDIAFQTNLLALNAGVEAARAGSAGRGFAVVASEVRALAQRCLEASNEITSLIGASGEHVKRGVSLVANAGSALESIAASVLQISDNVGHIAEATAEQSHGLGEINDALNQLDQATQHNAAMAEETSAAARALSDEAENLNETTNEFKLTDETVPRTSQDAA